MINMNEWGKNSDDGVVGAMGTPRVSARSRFGVGAGVAGPRDYGDNDNHRVVIRHNSKVGINGSTVANAATNDHDGDNAGGGVVGNRGPASLVKGAYDRHGARMAQPARRGGGGGFDDGGGVNKDRPWRTSSSSSSSSSISMTSTQSTLANKITTNATVLEESDRFPSSSSSSSSSSSDKVGNINDDGDVNYDGSRAAMEMRKTSEIMGGIAGTGYGDDNDDGVTMRTTDYVKSRLSSLLYNKGRDGGGGRDVDDAPYMHPTTADHDKVRNEAFKMLHLADSCLQDSPNNWANKNAKPTALFRTRGGGLAMREMQDDEVEAIKGRRGGGIASIAGLDKFGAGSAYDRSFGIDSHDDEDDAPSSRGGVRKGGDGSVGVEDGRRRPPSPNEDTPSLWSSRYSVERQLMAITGGLDSTHMLAKMDMLHSSREKTKSARGMYRSSGYAMDGSHVEYEDYTKSSSSPGLGFGMGSVMGLWMHVRGTLWSDDLELNHDGTTQSLVKREKAMQRRRRMRCGLLFFAGLCIAVGVLVHRGNPKNAYGAAMTGDVNFYVVADEPYQFSNIAQLTRDLQAVPASADFVVHLGNANGDDESMCKEYGFERAAAVLKQSPVPVLVLPGDKDWAACGSEESSTQSLDWWKAYLGKLEDHWDHELQVEHDDAVIGNFAFLRKGVLFVGISMIDGITSPGEVTSRLERNVLWTKEKLTRYDAGGTGAVDVHGHHVGGGESSGYHAVVIFGHAPPSDIQGEYFWPMLEQFNKIGRPVLYLHANKSGSFERYTPYDEAVNFSAVQLEKRGVEAPMKVVVRERKNKGGDGADTFVFERREPNVEREDE
ncbi:hypothetical protein ACHAXA_005247 [Cyclostephanos tholiformis]|uniref:Calcineurin-like phosphoesterase domain-containing protein n=1 Tax=Cyclostephanos tholiformis TaxID=382380 RepID=A0ABD3R0J9_9STRA